MYVLHEGIDGGQLDGGITAPGGGVVTDADDEPVGSGRLSRRAGDLPGQEVNQPELAHFPDFHS